MEVNIHSVINQMVDEVQIRSFYVHDSVIEMQGKATIVQAAAERAAAEEKERQQLAAERAAAEEKERQQVAAERAIAEEKERQQVAEGRAVAEEKERRQVAAERAVAEEKERRQVAEERAAAEEKERRPVAAERAIAEEKERRQVAAERAIAEEKERQQVAAERAIAEETAVDDNQVTTTSTESQLFVPTADGISDIRETINRIEEVNKVILKSICSDLIHEGLASLISELTHEVVHEVMHLKPIIQGNVSQSSSQKIEYVKISNQDSEDEESNIFARGENGSSYVDMDEIQNDETYHKLWLERKSVLEKEAERKARIISKQWQRDKIPLKRIIDDSLKEYIDLYEKARSLYLQFEYEKSEWIGRMRQSMQDYSIVGIEEVSFQYEVPSDNDEDQNNKKKLHHPNEPEQSNYQYQHFLTKQSRKRKFSVPKKDS